MRIGSNPQKDKVLTSSDYFHQVVVPVYIPNLDGYFKDSFVILQYCLDSLFLTSHRKTYFTIVNNGSCKLVKDYLDDLYKSNKIHELINTTNIGYINAILKGIAGQNFPFLSTVDADVLFLNNWQEETYKIFKYFPKTGVVAPSPNSKMLRSLTNNVLCENLLSRKMKFSNVENPQAMIDFSKSINNPGLFNEHHLNKYMTIINGEGKAMVGAGHFVVTYRSDVFQNLEQKSTEFVLGGGSDDLLDYPVIKKGYWRLSTTDNYAYHMGNSLESWMLSFSELLKNNNLDYKELPVIHEVKINSIMNWFNLKFFSKILLKKPFWKFFLRYKGLSKKEAKYH